MARRAMATAGRKVFPDHWSFLLGEIAAYSLVVLFGTGIALAFVFDASDARVVYDGDYEPLAGVEMSRAYRSVVDLSLGGTAGLALRQTHHWAALVFVGAIALHACRVFFTGAFRRPRRLNWSIGVTLLALALLTGFAGVALPDDVLGGTGARIGYASVLSVPVVGPGLAFWVFGGEFPGAQMVNRLWLFHVFVLPLAIAGAFGSHLWLLWRQTHTQMPGPWRRDRSIAGDRLWPRHLARTSALFAVVVAVLGALGATVQVNPVWLHGPFDEGAATVPAGPDWFLMWIEGALRIVPAVGVELGSFEVPSPFFVGVALPLAFFALLYAWPLIEERATGDRAEHHTLERPADRPVRAALGSTALSVLAVLGLAANHDYLGSVLGVSIEDMTAAFRLLLVVVPPSVGAVVFVLARQRSGARRPAGARRRAPAA
ncbi:MAG: cytochrome b [Acidimicrobiia bacterium]